MLFPAFILQSGSSFLPLFPQSYSHISFGTYHVVPLAQEPIYYSEILFRSLFCVLSPLMFPLQAASDMDYKLSLWAYVGVLMPRKEMEFSL